MNVKIFSLAIFLAISYLKDISCEVTQTEQKKTNEDLSKRSEIKSKKGKQASKKTEEKKPFKPSRASTHKEASKSQTIQERPQKTKQAELHKKQKCIPAAQLPGGQGPCSPQVQAMAKMQAQAMLTKMQQALMQEEAQTPCDATLPPCPQEQPTPQQPIAPPQQGQQQPQTPTQVQQPHPPMTQQQPAGQQGQQPHPPAGQQGQQQAPAAQQGQQKPPPPMPQPVQQPQMPKPQPAPVLCAQGQVPAGQGAMGGAGAMAQPAGGAPPCVPGGAGAAAGQEIPFGSTGYEYGFGMDLDKQCVKPEFAGCRKKCSLTCPKQCCSQPKKNRS